MVLAIACIAIAVILAALKAALPWLAEELVVPELAARLDSPGLRADVRRADFTGLDLGEITLGPESGVQAAAVQADWSLTGLLHGKLDRIRVMGLRVTAREDDGAWIVPGLPRTQGAGGSNPASVPHIADLRVDGIVELEGASLDVRLPFTLSGRIDAGATVALEARTELAGQPLRLTLGGDLSRRDLRLTCALPTASVAALASLVPGLRDLPVAGAVEALVDAALPPDGRPDVRASLTFDSLQAVPDGQAVAQDGNASVNLHWTDSLGLNFAPVRLRSPLPLILTVGDIAVDPAQGALDCAWNLTLPAAPGLNPASPLSLAATTSVRRTPDGWDLRTRGALAPFGAGLQAMPGLTAKIDKSLLSVDVSTSASSTRLDASLELGRARATRGQAAATLAGLSLVCNATQDVSGTAADLSLSGGRLEIRQPGLTVRSTRIDGAVRLDRGETAALSGRIAAGLNAWSGDVAATMNLRLPLAWPSPAASAGTLAVDVSWKKRSLAKISSRIAQNMHGFALDGTAAVPPAGIRAGLKGFLDAARPESSWVEARIDQRLELPGDLPRFVPALATLSGSARLEGSARLDLSRGVPAVPAGLQLTDISLEHGKAKAALTGGALGLAFADLLAARSEPDQRLTFERLQLGDVILDKGDIRFQVEAPHSVLVEACGFRWAGGRIGTQAFRVNPGVEDYTVEMYCDRVELAQALGQLGMTQARGGGTANGRIPVRWADGALTFDNGFLYSTPGEKGVLRIEGTEILTAGVPPGTPQYGQLDLASEALKDFAYEWAKVTMNTVERELVVSLQLDGKPEKALPFVYDREIGGFARVSASSPGSVFQGIRLDVNFRLPLDQLLHYRQLLELMNNGG
jgi:hypothetical protein